MANYPITHGYTINIVKDRSKSAAVILLNQTKKLDIGAHGQTLCLTVPSSTLVVPDEHEHCVETEQIVPEQHTEEKPSEADVYLEPVSANLESNSVGFFTEVAHEEIVEEFSCVPQISVHCDLCNSKLSSTEEAKLHMKTVHNVLSYKGWSLVDE